MVREASKGSARPTTEFTDFSSIDNGVTAVTLVPMWIRISLPDPVHWELKAQAALNGQSLLSFVQEILTTAAGLEDSDD